MKHGGVTDVKAGVLADYKTYRKIHFSNGRCPKECPFCARSRQKRVQAEALDTGTKGKQKIVIGTVKDLLDKIGIPYVGVVWRFGTINVSVDKRSDAVAAKKALEKLIAKHDVMWAVADPVAKKRGVGSFVVSIDTQVYESLEEAAPPSDRAIKIAGTLNDGEVQALDLILQLKPFARAEEWEYRKFPGEYSASNDLVAALVKKGVLKVNAKKSIIASRFSREINTASREAHGRSMGWTSTFKKKL